MALTLYSQGDLVAHKYVFRKCGRVIESTAEGCLVWADGEAIAIPDNELILISVRNIPNLRLISEKVRQAQTTAQLDQNLVHAVIAYVGSGTVVSLAFADYCLKIPADLLSQCLEKIAHTGCAIEQAVESVLGLSFALISGKT
ncbi:MAG: hypothetical protein AB4042_01770 [Leptolyngbyaceae cyanobacterium]